MGLNGALGLGFIFEAKDAASETIHKVREGLEEMKKAGEEAHESVVSAVKGIGAAAAATAAAIAIAAGASFELAEHSEKFSGAILNAGIAAHATKEEIEGLEKFAQDKALDSLGKSAIGVAETLQELAREGFNVNESMTAVDSTMKLMRFSTLGARDAASLVHDTIAEFGMTADQSGELVDKLAFAMREFHFRAEELRPAMAGLASGAHLANASFDDTLIGVGILKDAFPNATRAAGAMNIALQQLASTNTQKELRGIGVSVRDTAGHVRPLLDVIQDLSARTANMSEAQLAHKLATIGSARAAGGLAVIIDQLRKGTKNASGELVTGGAALDVYRDKLSKTSGTADGLVDLLNDSFGASVDKVSNAISNLGMVIGKSLEGPWKHALQTANLFIRGLTQLFTQGGFSGDIMKELDKTDNQGLQGFLIKIYVWVYRIKNFFESLKDSFVESFKKYGPVIDEITDAFKTLGHALGLTEQSSDDNKSAFDNAGSAGKSLGSTLAEVAGIISDVVLLAVDLLTASVILMKMEWESVGPAVKDVLSVVGGLLKMFAANDAPTFCDGLVDLMLGMAKLIWRGLSEFIVKPLLYINDLIAGVVGHKQDTLGAFEGAQNELMNGVDRGGGVIKDYLRGHPGVAAVAPDGKPAPVGGSPAPATSQDQMVTIMTALHVDGEKLATAISKAKRNTESRSFMSPATAPAGGF